MELEPSLNFGFWIFEIARILFTMSLRPITFSIACALFITSCKLPVVNLATPEAIKVDVTMRLNIYQYRGDENAKPGAEQVSYEESVLRQRNRMAEVQTLKNNRLVGEDHRALLHMREKPAGEWGKQVEETVNKENEDRSIMMRHDAKESDKQIHEIEAVRWKGNIEKAFKGEWIEIPASTSNTYKWVQAEGPKLKVEPEKKP